MILTEVYVPAVDEQFDFMLDENLQVMQIIVELREVLEARIKEPVIEKQSYMLCSIDSSWILPEKKTLADCRIRDGSRLLLV